jgi:hypothetical protein
MMSEIPVTPPLLFAKNLELGMTWNDGLSGSGPKLGPG